MMMNNPQGAVALAKMGVKQVPPPFDVNTVADLFLQVWGEASPAGKEEVVGYGDR